MARKQYDDTEGSLRTGLQKLKGFIVFCLLFAAMAFFGVKILSQHTLPIRSVQIGGKFEYVKSASVKDVVKPLVKGNFFTIEIDKIQVAIEDLVWVDRVSVQRVWPDTLRIVVYEHQPIARWHTEGLISSRGVHYLGKLKEGGKHLPLFIGPKNYSRGMAMEFLEVSKALSKANLKIRRLTVNPRRAWTVLLTNGIQLRIGRKHVVARAKRLARVYPKVLKHKEAAIKAIDLRYTNGFAVQWKRGKKSKTYAYGVKKRNG